MKVSSSVHIYSAGHADSEGLVIAAAPNGGIRVSCVEAWATNSCHKSLSREEAEELYQKLGDYIRSGDQFPNYLDFRSANLPDDWETPFMRAIRKYNRMPTEKEVTIMADEISAMRNKASDDEPVMVVAPHPYNPYQTHRDWAYRSSFLGEIPFCKLG